MLDIEKMDLKDFYVQSVVTLVNCQNEIVAANKAKVKK